LAVSVGGSLLGGKESKKAGKREAALLRREAGARRAEGHYAAEEERRQARYLESRALAVAAASGGGVSDPTVVNILADIDAEGEYRAMMRKYSADIEAEGFEERAEIAEKGGQAGAVASYISGATTLLSDGGDLWKKYKTTI
jgi:hypothetical protein